MSSPRATAGGTVIRFGVFEVDIRAGELRKQGVRVKLQEQPLQILQFLLERSGEVVTREELRQRIWPADTFVDFDHGLYNAIKRLREALGDSADNPRFIETLARRGYRFIGQVSTPADAAEKPTDSGLGLPSPGAAGAELPSIAVETRQRIPEGGAAQTEIAAPTLARHFHQRVAFALTSLVLLVGLGSLGIMVRQRTTAPPAIRSLAVLPLQNLSGDPAQEYLTDGMTEELITELSRINALRVISRTSSMRYKKTDKSLPEIARDLNVDAVVEGSVLRSGDRVRITAQLIYAPEDKNVWADSYDRDVKDLLAVEHVVANSIAGEIRVKTTTAERTRMGSVPSVNLKAHEAYLQGRYHQQLSGDALFKKDKGEFGVNEAKIAEDYFQESIREDPNYAPAYLGLWEARSCGNGPLPPPNAAAGGKPLLLKALQLDDSFAEGHRVLAMLLKNYDWDWTGSEAEYKRAIQIEPSNSDAHHEYADLLADTGRIQEAVQEYELAQSLDPKNDHLADVFVVTRQFDRAIELYQRQAQMNLGNFNPHMQLAYLFALTGRRPEAVSEWQKMVTTLGYEDLSNAIGRAYRVGGYNNALGVFVRELEVSSHSTYIPAWYIASVYGFKGDKDQAFAWLERAYTEKEDGVDTLNEPIWDPLRSDPRFQDLLRRVGLPR